MRWNPMVDRDILPSTVTMTSNPDIRIELVQRVADRDYFGKAPKIRARLLYVCENTILGRPEDVREHMLL